MNATIVILLHIIKCMRTLAAKIEKNNTSIVHQQTVSYAVITSFNWQSAVEMIKPSKCLLCFSHSLSATKLQSFIESDQHATELYGQIKNVPFHRPQRKYNSFSSAG